LELIKEIGDIIDQTFISKSVLMKEIENNKDIKLFFAFKDMFDVTYSRVLLCTYVAMTFYCTT